MMAISLASLIVLPTLCTRMLVHGWGHFCSDPVPINH
jgi:hypothetical protein